MAALALTSWWSGTPTCIPGATISNMEELDLASGVQEVFLTSAQLADFDVITHLDGSGARFSITAQKRRHLQPGGQGPSPAFSPSKARLATIPPIGSSGDDILSGKGEPTSSRPETATIRSSSAAVRPVPRAKSSMAAPASTGWWSVTPIRICRR
jgi:hypothetical protein